MTPEQQQLSEMQQRNLDAAMRLAQLAIDNSQRILHLQVETARALVEEGVSNAKTLAQTTDPAESMRLRTQFAQDSTQRMMNCAKSIAEIAGETQMEFGKMVTEQLSDGGKSFVEAMHKDPAAAIKAAMDSAKAAFDQFTKASTDAWQSMGSMAVKPGKPSGKVPKE